MAGCVAEPAVPKHDFTMTRGRKPTGTSFVEVCQGAGEVAAAWDRADGQRTAIGAVAFVRKWGRRSPAMAGWVAEPVVSKHVVYDDKGGGSKRGISFSRCAMGAGSIAKISDQADDRGRMWKSVG